MYKEIYEFNHRRKETPAKKIAGKEDITIITLNRQFLTKNRLTCEKKLAKKKSWRRLRKRQGAISQIRDRLSFWLHCKERIILLPHHNTLSRCNRKSNEASKWISKAQF